MGAPILRALCEGWEAYSGRQSLGANLDRLGFTQQILRHANVNKKLTWHNVALAP